jgi:phosphatidylinositol 4-kinase
MTGIAHFGAIDRGVDMRHGDDPSVGRKVLIDQIPVINKILADILHDVKSNKAVPIGYLHHALYRAAGLLITLPKVDGDMIRNIVRIPVQIFSPDSMHIGTAVWDWIVVERPDFETLLMVEMLSMWNWCQRHRRGLFSPVLNSQHPFVSRMTYTPSDKAIRQKNSQVANYLFAPHMTWIYFLSSRFHAIAHRNKQLVNLFIRLIQESMQNFHLLSTHPLSRMGRFQLLVLAVRMLQANRMEALQEYKFRHLLYQTAFNWFTLPARWQYGSRKTSALAEYKVVLNFYNAIANDKPNLNRMVTSSLLKTSSTSIASGLYNFLGGKTKDDVVKYNAQCKKLLMLFLESEMNRMSVWSNPLNTPGHGNSGSFINTVEKSMLVDELWKDTVRLAWEIDPRLAVQLPTRFKNLAVESELRSMIANNTLDVVNDAEALVILLGDKLAPNTRLNLKYLQYWSPTAPITAVSLFSPAYNNHPMVLQYAMRTLEYYPVDTVFFYVPQVVQALRSDDLGYVERYIMEAGSVSQLFAHQIIWNMKANFFVDADKECLKPDTLKPTLERIIHNLVQSFSGADKAFYQREFKFFGEVTAISGYLKEYIKYGQNEKKPMQKKRLDEEMAKIQVDVGVYLPSNPEGRVVDINRTSGRPLQSHAKAPFMATFKIEKELEEVGPKKTLVADNGSLSSEHEDKQTIQVWQGAIFKVGDDCRQDLLALQLIAVFKNIFTSVGLDLYVLPYRVVATAPGCGMIDVIPRSISRDQLGREKVNSMYDYFIAKYGGEDSIEFQRARMNFVQSVAAYSVISYLLQIKDRHNGNIMLDDDGHIIHIGKLSFIFVLVKKKKI